jgi:hypothetical protein
MLQNLHWIKNIFHSAHQNNLPVIPDINHNMVQENEANHEIQKTNNALVEPLHNDPNNS